MTDYLTICERAVRAGAEAILRRVDNMDVREKAPADLVTQADVESQQAVTSVIREHFPDHGVIGEEDTHDAAAGRSTAPDSEFRWIVDPLDGTLNFVHGVPHYCVSLGLERKGKLLAAAVYDPMMDECFTAAVGAGAKLNGRPIRVSNVAKLTDSLAVVGFPPGVTMQSPDLLVFLEALPHCQAIRRSGSTALNMCYLAAGRYDLFWSFSAKIWDLAAGILIIREAGGVICASDGKEYRLGEGPLLMAATPALLAELQKLTIKSLKK